MQRDVAFVRLQPQHLFAIERQPSQQVLLGVEASVTEEEAGILCSMPEAWAMLVGGRPIACFGISEIFAGHHGVAWAVLASGLGRAHVALTRFARARLAACGYARIETFARAEDVEGLVARYPNMDTGQLVAMVMTRQTPEIRWARLLGFGAAHVLRRYGGGDETYMLLERIAPRVVSARKAA